jgi:hypothetical protein
MIPALTAIAQMLLANNLPKLAQAALDKGVEYVEQKTGIKLSPTTPPTPEDLASLRDHEYRMARMQIEDGQAEHRQQQETIQNGDNSSDEYVRRTRPMMARQSWYGAAAYVFAFEGAKLFDKGTGADWEIAMMLLSVALAYNGFRTFDKSKWGRK